MWADKETDLDFLNFSEVASITADLIRRPNLLPLSIGIFGNWGSGKSSMLRLVQQDMLNKFNGSEDQSPFLFVNFDAWLYQDFDDARAALMETIGKRLLSQAQSDTPVAKKALKFLKRVNYFRAIGSAMDVGAAIAFGIPPVGIAKRAMDALGNFAHGAANAEDVASLKEATTKGKEAAEGFLKPEETTTPPEEITAFRKEFAELLTDDFKKTLVVFVDNLDRCLPAVAINTLEAIRLFLFLPNTAFVIAADEDMIRLSVEKHFDGLSAKHVTDYLDKLIQVPIRVPRVGTQELRAYMFLLLISETVSDAAAFQRARTFLATYLRNSWKGDKPTSEQVLKEIGIDTQELRSRLDLADRLAPVLASAPNVMGNPRIVKRLFNTIMMRAKIAKDHDMPIDEALLAKLAVFERCTDEKTTGEFLQLINNAPEGKAEIFERMEGSIENEEKLRELMPTEWAGRHWDFIVKWLDLEPKLGGRDLRGALYLSRETVAFSVRPGKMSAQAADGVTALMKVQTMSSPNAAKLVKNLTPRDQDEVMTAIIAELHKVEDWSKSPPGFSGAVVLADANESTGQQFASFLENLPQGSVPPWMKVALKEKTWAKKLTMFQTKIKPSTTRH